MDTQDILKLIRKDEKSRETAIRHLYNNVQLRNGLKKVLNSYEEDEHFHDVFNLTLVQFMKTVLKNKDFTVKSNLHSYLFVIAKHIDLSKGKQRVKTRSLAAEDQVIIDEDAKVDLHILNEDIHANLKSFIQSMGRNCYEILWNWAAGFKMNEIAEKLGYNSAEVARRKKYTCLQKLSKKITENPQIKKFFKE